MAHGIAPPPLVQDRRKRVTMRRMTHPQPEPKRPSRVLTVIGAVLAALLGALLFYVGANEYLFPAWGRYVALGVGLAIALAIRLRTRRSGHEVAWVLLALFVYNAHLSLGGYTFLGWYAPVAFVAPVVGAWLFLRRRTVLWRILAGLNIAFFVGLILLMVHRDFTFVDEAEKCRGEKRALPHFVHVVDGPRHPYDFGGYQEDETIGVAFGYESKFFRLRHEGPRLVEGGEVDARIQRVTPHPLRREFYVPVWAQWGADERILVMDMDTGAKIGEVPVPGCRNLFEIEFFHDRLYALCEVSHSLHELEAAPPFTPLRTLKLPGMDSYDFAIDLNAGRAYVTDWLSPWLVEVDLRSMAVVRKKWIGFSSFGVNIGPDGRLYVAQMFLRRVNVLDVLTLETRQTLRAGYGPRDLDFDPQRGLLFVGNYFDGTVDVFETASGRRVTRFFAGKPLRGLWFDRQRERLYLACGCGVRWAELAEIMAVSTSR